MSDETISLSSRGQIVIPADVRREMGLDRDTEFVVEVEDGQIVLTPLEEDWRSLRGCLSGLDEGVDEMLESERRLEERREEQQAGGN